MFKKFKNLEDSVVSTSLQSVVASLSEAQKIATQRTDMEALIVIAERWFLIAEKLKGLDGSKPIMLGFTSNMPEEDLAEDDLEEFDESDEH